MDISYIPGKGIDINEETLEPEMQDKIAMDIISLNERERVSPKFEEWRNPYTYKIAEGGRGAGAKSWSGASLLIQKYNYTKEKLQCICVREYMNSLAESSYSLLQKTIERLGYPYWVFTREYIKNVKNGSYFIFRGLHDLRSAMNLKSYEGFDDLFADEAAPILMESWSTIVPTLRKKTKEIWVLYNRVEETDPCHRYFVINRRPNTSYLHLEPGPVDNPWWFESSLPEDMAADYKRDPVEAEHIWKGFPRKQGLRSAISRLLIREAMDRVLEELEGREEAGVDVARYGDDATDMYLRKGMKTIAHEELRKADTIEVALTVWDFVGRNPEIPIKIDVGYNPGVVDLLLQYGANVIPINFGGLPDDEDKYTSAADEMWFEFPVTEADIPDDSALMEELSQRQYGYDKKGRRKIEPKDDFKKRLGRSPDKADALLLCYYETEGNATYEPSGFSASMLGL